MREITMATVQMRPELGKVEENLAKMSDAIARIATQQPVDLIIFPELITTGYEAGPRFPQLAQHVPGSAVNVIAQRAADFGVHVAFGLVTKEKVESIIYDSAVLIGPDGALLGERHKLHLRGEERIAFRPGYRIDVIETELGVLGLIVGWDLAFPEVARSLVLDGAELLVVCANWESPNADEWWTYLRARAYENTVFVAAANRVGEEPSYTFFGQSCVMGPRAKVHASVDDPVEGYAVATINLDAVRTQREETQILQCRQPAAYRSIVRKY